VGKICPQRIGHVIQRMRSASKRIASGILCEMSEVIPVTQQRIAVGSSNSVEGLTTSSTWPAMYDHLPRPKGQRSRSRNVSAVITLKRLYCDSRRRVECWKLPVRELRRVVCLCRASALQCSNAIFVCRVEYLKLPVRTLLRSLCKNCLLFFISKKSSFSLCILSRNYWRIRVVGRAWK